MTYSGQRECLNAILMSWFDFLSQASFFFNGGVVTGRKHAFQNIS